MAAPSAVVLPPSPNWFSSQVVAVLPSQQLVAYGGHYAVVVACAQSRTVQRMLPTGGSRVTCVALPPESVGGRPLVAAGCEDGSLRCWDMVSGEPVRTHRKGKAPEVTALVALPSSPVLQFVAGDASGGLVLWVPETGVRKPLTRAGSTAPLLPSRVQCLVAVNVTGPAAGASGRVIAGLADGSIVLVDVASASVLLTLPAAHRGGVHSLQLAGLPLVTTAGGGGSSSAPAPGAVEEARAAPTPGSAAGEDAAGEPAAAPAAVAAAPDLWILSSGEDCQAKVWSLPAISAAAALSAAAAEAAAAAAAGGDGSAAATPVLAAPPPPQPLVTLRLPPPPAGQQPGSGPSGPGGAVSRKAWVPSALVPGCDVGGSGSELCVAVAAPWGHVLVYHVSVGTGKFTLATRLKHHARTVFTLHAMRVPHEATTATAAATATTTALTTASTGSAAAAQPAASGLLLPQVRLVTSSQDRAFLVVDLELQPAASGTAVAVAAAPVANAAATAGEQGHDSGAEEHGASPGHESEGGEHSEGHGDGKAAAGGGARGKLAAGRADTCSDWRVRPSPQQQAVLYDEAAAGGSHGNSPARGGRAAGPTLVPPGATLVLPRGGAVWWRLMGLGGYPHALDLKGPFPGLLAVGCGDRTIRAVTLTPGPLAKRPQLQPANAHAHDPHQPAKHARKQGAIDAEGAAADEHVDEHETAAEVHSNGAPEAGGSGRKKGGEAAAAVMAAAGGAEGPWPSSLLWKDVRDQVVVVAWHPVDSRYLAFGCADGSVGLMDVKTQTSRVFGVRHSGPVTQLAWVTPPAGSAHVSHQAAAAAAAAAAQQQQQGQQQQGQQQQLPPRPNSRGGPERLKESSASQGAQVAPTLAPAPGQGAGHHSHGHSPSRSDHGQGHGQGQRQQQGSRQGTPKHYVLTSTPQGAAAVPAQSSPEAKAAATTSPPKPVPAAQAATVHAAEAAAGRQQPGGATRAPYHQGVLGQRTPQQHPHPGQQHQQPQQLPMPMATHMQMHVQAPMAAFPPAFPQQGYPPQGYPPQAYGQGYPLQQFPLQGGMPQPHHAPYFNSLPYGAHGMHQQQPYGHVAPQYGQQQQQHQQHQHQHHQQHQRTAAGPSRGRPGPSGQGASGGAPMPPPPAAPMPPPPAPPPLPPPPMPPPPPAPMPPPAPPPPSALPGHMTPDGGRSHTGSPATTRPSGSGASAQMPSFIVSKGPVPGGGFKGRVRPGSAGDLTTVEGGAAPATDATAAQQHPGGSHDTASKGAKGAAHADAAHPAQSGKQRRASDGGRAAAAGGSAGRSGTSRLAAALSGPPLFLLSCGGEGRLLRWPGPNLDPGSAEPGLGPSLAQAKPIDVGAQLQGLAVQALGAAALAPAAGSSGHGHQHGQHHHNHNQQQQHGGAGAPAGLSVTAMALHPRRPWLAVAVAGGGMIVVEQPAKQPGEAATSGAGGARAGSAGPWSLVAAHTGAVSGGPDLRYLRWADDVDEALEEEGHEHEHDTHHRLEHVEEVAAAATSGAPPASPPPAALLAALYGKASVAVYGVAAAPTAAAAGTAVPSTPPVQQMYRLAELSATADGGGKVTLNALAWLGRRCLALGADDGGLQLWALPEARVLLAAAVAQHDPDVDNGAAAAATHGVEAASGPAPLRIKTLPAGGQYGHHDSIIALTGLLVPASVKGAPATSAGGKKKGRRASGAGDFDGEHPAEAAGGHDGADHGRHHGRGRAGSHHGQAHHDHGGAKPRGSGGAWRPAAVWLLFSGGRDQAVRCWRLEGRQLDGWEREREHQESAARQKQQRPPPQHEGKGDGDDHGGSGAAPAPQPPPDGSGAGGAGAGSAAPSASNGDAPSGSSPGQQAPPAPGAAADAPGAEVPGATVVAAGITAPERLLELSPTTAMRRMRRPPPALARPLLPELPDMSLPHVAAAAHSLLLRLGEALYPPADDGGEHQARAGEEEQAARQQVAAVAAACGLSDEALAAHLMNDVAPLREAGAAVGPVAAPPELSFVASMWEGDVGGALSTAAATEGMVSADVVALAAAGGRAAWEAASRLYAAGMAAAGCTGEAALALAAVGDRAGAAGVYARAGMTWEAQQVA